MLMKSKEARARRARREEARARRARREEDKAAAQDFFSPHNVAKRDMDNNNDRKGAIEAQRRRRRERLHEDTEDTAETTPEV